jgi:hypothetical protein
VARLARRQRSRTLKAGRGLSQKQLKLLEG